MWMDAIDIRDFYATPLGRMARRAISRRVRAHWPDVSGLSVLGIGYPTPYLEPMRGEASRTIAAMPAAQGVLRWPRDASGLATLTNATELPFADVSMDRIILVHALECAEQVRPLLREAWRVLSESGRLLVVAPNRSGVWARFERTPFGHGQPYSPSQLSRAMREVMFTPLSASGALFIPPSRSRMMISSAPAWEKIGVRWFPAFAGVVVAEAAKQIYGGQVEPEKARRRAYLPLAQKNPGA
ncbi:MAG TPA: methyltransferase domain-containing protein [Alphaproteobacteria bacterium]|nr:methyltransferase domain-containing protein [Alphaproteobacteria bacterium]